MKPIALQLYSVREELERDFSGTLEKIKEMKPNEGYDALADKYCDLVDAGIIDPTKVVRCALQNAASVAGLLLTTDALVAEIPEKKPAPGPGGPGGPGDYGGDCEGGSPRHAEL